MTSIFLINQFLREFKEIVTTSNWLDIIRRSENLNGMLSLGIDPDIATEEILSLTYKNYFEGPKDDIGIGRDGHVWVFGKFINEWAYIKLKIDIRAGKKIAKCLSIHPACFTMKLPYSDQNN